MSEVRVTDSVNGWCMVGALRFSFWVTDRLAEKLAALCLASLREDQTGPETLIKYMTDGMLLREILSDDMASTLGTALAVICVCEVFEGALFGVG